MSKRRSRKARMLDKPIKANQLQKKSSKRIAAKQRRLNAEIAAEIETRVAFTGTGKSRNADTLWKPDRKEGTITAFDEEHSTMIKAEKAYHEAMPKQAPITAIQICCGACLEPILLTDSMALNIDSDINGTYQEHKHAPGWVDDEYLDPDDFCFDIYQLGLSNPDVKKVSLKKIDLPKDLTKPRKAKIDARNEAMDIQLQHYREYGE